MKPLRPLFGRALMLVVFVDGPSGTTAAFTPGETIQALGETFVGCGLLRRLAGTWAGAQNPPLTTPCSFVSATRTVTLSLPPSTLPTPTGPSLPTPKPVVSEFATVDRVWLNAALDALGVPGAPDPDPATNFTMRVDSMATALSIVGTFGLGVDDVLPIFITKYPAYWLAYAHRRRFIVLHWPSMVGSFTNMIDRVVAHEMGHIFGAPDEYASSGCLTSETTGPFATPNANCKIIQRTPPPDVPNPAAVPCLMSSNDPVLCSSTPLHWGWLDSDADGVADLIAAPTVTDMDSRAGSPDSLVNVKGVNLWDANAAAFDADPATAIEYVQTNGSLSPLEQAETFLTYDLGSLLLTVPGGSSGISLVSVTTRAGTSASPLTEAWYLRAPAGVIPSGPNVPIVFGVSPNSGPAGTSITIFGQDLDGPVDVTVGGVSVGAIQEDVPGSQVTVVVPAGGVGIADVVFTGARGTSISWALSVFTYI